MRGQQRLTVITAPTTALTAAACTRTGCLLAPALAALSSLTTLPSRARFLLPLVCVATLRCLATIAAVSLAAIALVACHVFLLD